MSDATTEPITLEAYNPGDLLMDANARANAEATVTKADVALCKTIAASRPDGCGNNVPISIVRRPDGGCAGSGRAPPHLRLPARRRPRPGICRRCRGR